MLAVKKQLELQQIGPTEAKQWLEMQIRSFKPFMEKYEDYNSSPAAEWLDIIFDRMTQDNQEHYFIHLHGQIVGGVRVNNFPNELKRYRIGLLFILPEYQNTGLGSGIIPKIEAFYPQAESWELETFAQEKRDIHFYEKFGYQQTDQQVKINDKLTVVMYKKLIGKNGKTKNEQAS